MTPPTPSTPRSPRPRRTARARGATTAPVRVARLARLAPLAALALPLTIAACASARPAAASHPSPAATARVGDADTTGVARMLGDFVVAFNDLDMPRFATFWARETSAIMPFPHLPRRIDGRDAVLAAFGTYFDAVKRERTGPPYLRIVPEQLDVRPLAPGSALATFHLRAAGGAQLGRRTLVLVREDGAWRIAHLHASMMAVAADTGAGR